MLPGLFYLSPQHDSQKWVCGWHTHHTVPIHIVCIVHSFFFLSVNRIENRIIIAKQMRIRSILRMDVDCILYMSECIVRFPVLLISWNKRRVNEIDEAKKTMMMNSLTKTSMHIHWRRALFYLNLSFLLPFLLTDISYLSVTHSVIHIQNACHSIYFTDALTIKIKR